MPSSNKTPYLKLNSWIGSDIPKMADFNADNALLDAAFAQLQEQINDIPGEGGADPRLDNHLADQEAHLSAQDRADLASSAPVVGTYVGDGNPFQGIVLGFRPRFGFVFAENTPIMTLNAAGNAQFTHFAVITQQGCTSGVETIPTGFQAKQLGSANQGGQTSIGLNKDGQLYVYRVWR
jgi:hypothetical protein